MDIDLLAKMVGELILENDEVALPGVGTFVAELVGASFSDKGFVINPPYRKLSFRQREGDGSLLIDFYARTNSLEKSTAADILTRYLAEMKEVLKTKKYVVFPGLGRLRATRENLFFFVPDENLNIYPEGFGLEPVSLKSHEELEEVAELAETAAAVAALTATAPEETPAQEEVPMQEEAPAPEAVPAQEEVATPEEAPAPEEALAPEETPAIEEIPAPADKTAVAGPILVPPAETPAPAAASKPEAPKSETSSEHHHHHHHHSSDGQGHSHSHSHSSDSQSHHHSSDGQSHHHSHHSHSHHSSSSRRRKLPVWQKELLILLGFAAAFLILLAVLGRVAPQFVDRFLYTREELEILYR